MGAVGAEELLAEAHQATATANERASKAELAVADYKNELECRTARAVKHHAKARAAATEARGLTPTAMRARVTRRLKRPRVKMPSRGSWKTPRLRASRVRAEGT